MQLILSHYFYCGCLVVFAWQFFIWLSSPQSSWKKRRCGVIPFLLYYVSFFISRGSCSFGSGLWLHLRNWIPHEGRVWISEQTAHGSKRAALAEEHAARHEVRAQCVFYVDVKVVRWFLSLQACKCLRRPRLNKCVATIRGERGIHHGFCGSVSFWWLSA